MRYLVIIHTTPFIPSSLLVRAHPRLLLLFTFGLYFYIPGFLVVLVVLVVLISPSPPPPSSSSSPSSSSLAIHYTLLVTSSSFCQPTLHLLSIHRPPCLIHPRPSPLRPSPPTQLTHSTTHIQTNFSPVRTAPSQRHKFLNHNTRKL